MRRCLCTILMAAIVIIVIAGCGGFESGGPVGAFSKYMQAVCNKDPDAAYEMLCAHAKSKETKAEFVRQLQQNPPTISFAEFLKRFTVKVEYKSGNRATIEVKRTHNWLNSNSNDWPSTCAAVKENGKWKLDFLVQRI